MTPDHDIPPSRLLEVGRIGRAHGVRGAVMVTLSTDRTERLATGSRLQCRGRWLTVASATPHTRRWLVRFAELTDRNEAEAHAGAVLLAEPLVDPDAMWVHELVGARVVEADGTERGTCTAVIDNPAADLLELDSGALVPVVFVESVVDGTVTIAPPDGLFDLFDATSGSPERAARPVEDP